MNGLVTSTTNWASFSEIAFTFRVTPGLLLAGLVFAVVMGVVGGFFPARRAARCRWCRRCANGCGTRHNRTAPPSPKGMRAALRAGNPESAYPLPRSSSFSRRLN